MRFADKACDVPDLVEEFGAALSKVRTRDETHVALVFLRLAANKGWDLTPANHALIDTCPMEWGPLAFDALTAQAERGIDVLSCRGAGGLEF